MSTNTIYKSGAIAVITLAGMSVAATANAQSSRYGGTVYDYESGQNCGQSCAAPAAPVTTSRYGSTVAPGPVYVDCRAMGTCAQPAPVYAAPAPTTVYTQPAPVQSYQGQSYQGQSYQSYSQNTYSAPVNCPAGTTSQPDGTCMQSGYSSGSNYSSSTYSAPATTYGEPVNCPAGTTAQSDGTCMQGGGSSSYSVTLPDTHTPSASYGYSSSSYSSASSAPVDCPAGTTAQSDGTCMQGGSSSYSGSSVELYTGDAATSSSSTSSYGYTSDGGYGATDYLPIRK